LVGCPKQHRTAQKQRQAPKDGAEDDDNGDDGDMSGMALAPIHPLGAGHSNHSWAMAIGVIGFISVEKNSRLRQMASHG
jgi:hypothetical protein